MIELFNEERPLSPFVEAVNDGRFVKTFGIVALVASLLSCGPGVMLGVGLAVFGFGKKRYYNWLGLLVAAHSNLSGAYDCGMPIADCGLKKFRNPQSAIN